MLPLRCTTDRVTGRVKERKESQENGAKVRGARTVDGPAEDRWIQAQKRPCRRHGRPKRAGSAVLRMPRVMDRRLGRRVGAAVEREVRRPRQYGA